MIMDASYWPPFEPSPSSSSSSLTRVNSTSPQPPVCSSDLKAIVSKKISTSVINYLIDRVDDAVQSGLRRNSDQEASTSYPRRYRSRADSTFERDRRAFYDFTTSLLRRAEVTLSIVLGALVYIERAEPYLHIAVEEWAHHRVLLGSLIVSAKYLNDTSLKNAHWALSSGIFGRRDVQRVEREFLDVLEFECHVREDDLVRVCSRLVDAGALEAPRRVQEKEEPSLDKVRQIWDETRRMLKQVQAEKQVRVQVQSSRPEKRQKSESMDMDVDEERGRYKERRTDGYTAGAAIVPRVQISLSVSPASSCSSCSSSSASPASSNSPQTPPQPSASAPPAAYNYPHYAVPSYNSTPSKSGSLSTGIAFPHVPSPSASASLPPAPLPQPRSGLPYYKISGGPKPAFPLDFDLDASMENGGEFFESPTCPVPTYRSRSRTSSKVGAGRPVAANQTHKRSSALAMYPSFVASVDA